MNADKDGHYNDRDVKDAAMERAFDAAYPEDKRDKPLSYGAHQIADLVDTIKGLHHQIKSLSDRHNEDVETIALLKDPRIMSDSDTEILPDCIKQPCQAFTDQVAVIASIGDELIDQAAELTRVYAAKKIVIDDLTERVTSQAAEIVRLKANQKTGNHDI